MDTDFEKIDLHIHTPASSCYKGKKEDEEYFRILKNAQKRKLRIISITDHNTISGYKTLFTLQAKLIERRETLIEFIGFDQAKKEIKNIEEKLNLFSNIIILPGVELEVKPGVHMLVIFNSTVTIQRIEEFLKDGGYEGDLAGSESPKITPKWDILNLLEESKSIDCIVFDPHTDSDKGILKATQKGVYRAQCFKHEELIGIGYNNEKQKDQLKATLTTAGEYSRKLLPAFVRFSDSHSYETVGSQWTWIKLDDFSFSSLKASLLNHEERVSVEEPTIKKILNRLLNSPNAIYIADITEDSLAKIPESVSALNNSSGGHILIGVSEEKNLIGIKCNNESKEPFLEPFEKIKSSLEPVLSECHHATNITFSVYQLQGQRWIFTIFVRPSKTFWNCNQTLSVPYFSKGKIVSLTLKDTQKMIEDRFLEDLKPVFFEKFNQIESNCNFLRGHLSSLNILRSFQAKSIPLHKKFYTKIETETRATKNLPNISNSLEKNGCARGNTFLLDDLYPTRYEECYLRLTIPRYRITKLGRKSSKRATVYIVPGGGVFYSDLDLPCLSSQGWPVKKIFSKDPTLYPELFLAAFLKSTFAIWFSKISFNETDVFDSSILNEILLPNPEVLEDNQDLVKSIVEISHDIIKQETDFLLKLKKSKKDLQLVNELITNHNNDITKAFWELDQRIFELNGIKSKDAETICNVVKGCNFYVPE